MANQNQLRQEGREDRGTRGQGDNLPSAIKKGKGEFNVSSPFSLTLFIWSFKLLVQLVELVG